MFNNNCGGTGIVPVMNVNGMGWGNGMMNGMWGDGGIWWIWILFFAMFGWGNGGWGGNGNSNAQFTDAAVQRGFDNQSVMNKLNGIENGICSLGYDQLNQMNGINSTVQQVGWNLQQTMNQNEIANMQRSFAAQQQASDCCCENRVGQMNIVNQMDKNNCATNTLIQQQTQQLMWTNQQGFRDISDQINAGFQRLEVRQLETENANLRQQLNNCDRDKALQGTANYIVNAVNPRTMPAYLTCNPNTGNVFPQAGLDQLAYQQWLQNRSGCCCQQNTCCNNGCGCGF